jgi:Fe2+ transport system protein B
MKERIKNKSFLQVPITIWIVLVIVAIGIGYGTGEYFQTSKIIKEAEELTKEEKYDEAIWKLEILKNTLFGKILSQKINTELEKNKRLLEDKMEYTQGLEEFNKENWEQAKELLSKVSENSPYYQDAKNKIEEAQQKIIEERVTEIVKKETERAKKNIIGVEPEIKGYQTSEIFASFIGFFETLCFCRALIKVFRFFNFSEFILKTHRTSLSLKVLTPACHSWLASLI